MRNFLAHRSTRLEKIDRPEEISPAEMDVVLRELRLVNRWLGGGGACLTAIAPFLKDFAESGERVVRVADLGSGSADIPVRLVSWARRNRVRLRVISMDWNQEVCRSAAARTRPFPEVEVVCGDIAKLPIRPGAVDVFVCSAFLHHFTDRALVEILGRLARTGSLILINDLHRHPLAYWAIRLLTRLFSRSRIVMHDGPLSVRKGFRRHELETACRKAGLSDIRIRWRWAFRWVVTARAPGNGHRVVD